MLVLGQKERCGDWAMSRIAGVQGWGEWYETIGWEEKGELTAVAVFSNYSGPDIQLHVAAIPGGHWLTRAALRAVFRYAFVQLGVRRITSHIPETNLASVRFNLHLGFTLEGAKREGWWDGDMLITGMLKSECRYL